MRVAFLVGTLEAGGLERFVTRVSLEARKKGAFDPIVVCLNKRTGVFLADLTRADVPVVEAPRYWYRSPLRLLKLVELLRVLKPDIVHSQVNYSIVQQFVAASLGGTKYTITERNCYTRKGVALIRRRLQYRMMKLFGVIYSANSERVASHLGAMLKEDSETFPVLPNGVVISRGVAEKDRIGQGVTIGYVSRMASHKGHLFFLQVLGELVHERRLDCRALLIGDGPLRLEIEKAIQELRLRDRVHLTGIIDNVEERLQECDILSLLSDYEGMPNVVIEAMAAGKPVIATDVGNTVQLLGSGAGIIVTKESVKLVADQFQHLIENPIERNNMGRLGQEIIAREFSMDNTLAALEAYYSTVLRR